MAPTSDAKENTRAGRKHQDLLFTFAFALVCIGSAIHFTSFRDIGLYDETAYLDRGLRISAQGLPTADMAPLYSFWYFVLHGLVEDPVQMYYLNQVITIALLPLLCLVTLRTLGTSWIASLTASSIVLVSTFNVLSWPRVSAFALIVLIIGWLIRCRIKDQRIGLSVLMAFTALAVFVRPELVLSLFLFVVWWLWKWLRGTNLAQPARWIHVASIIILLIGLRVAFGDPLANGRSHIAFGQHYALNKVAADRSDIDPWTNWEHIVQEDFGAVSGLSAAFRARPDRVLWHMVQDLKAIPRAISQSLLPASVRSNAYVMIGLLISFILLVIKAFRSWKQHRARSLEMIVTATILSIPATVSMIVIHPREHYVLFPVCCLGIVLVACAFPKLETEGLSIRRNAVLFGIVMIMVPVLGARLAKGERPVLRTIEALRRLPLRSRATVVDADGGYGVYLATPTTRIQAQEKDTAFTSWLERVEPDVIVASPRLLSDHRYRNDKAWQDFLGGGYHERYRRQLVSGTKVELFIASSATTDN